MLFISLFGLLTCSKKEDKSTQTPYNLDKPAKNLINNVEKLRQGVENLSKEINSHYDTGKYKKNDSKK